MARQNLAALWTLYREAVSHFGTTTPWSCLARGAVRRQVQRVRRAA